MALRNCVIGSSNRSQAKLITVPHPNGTRCIFLAACQARSPRISEPMIRPAEDDLVLFGARETSITAAFLKRCNTTRQRAVMSRLVKSDGFAMYALLPLYP